MSVKIRLARGGSKKRPFYRIVAADTRMPRDGRFLEKLGTYNPLLAKDDENRVKMDVERVMELIKLGAKPTDRIARFLEAGGHMDKTERNNPEKAKPGQKALDRIEEKKEKAESAAAAEAEAKEAADAAAAEAEAAPAEEAPAEEAPAEEEAKS
ncbi:MAG: 30S ribosomal protein S16 [Pseudomonadota bacterium]